MRHENIEKILDGLGIEAGDGRYTLATTLATRSKEDRKAIMGLIYDYNQQIETLDYSNRVTLCAKITEVLQRKEDNAPSDIEIECFERLQQERVPESPYDVARVKNIQVNTDYLNPVERGVVTLNRTGDNYMPKLEDALELETQE